MIHIQKYILYVLLNRDSHIWNEIRRKNAQSENRLDTQKLWKLNSAEQFKCNYHSMLHKTDNKLIKYSNISCQIISVYLKMSAPNNRIFWPYFRPWSFNFRNINKHTWCRVYTQMGISSKNKRKSFNFENFRKNNRQDKRIPFLRKFYIATLV